MADAPASERTCDYPGCAAPTTVQDVFGDHYCASDHLTAARNEWDPDALERFTVEYDGVSGTYRAPSREQADSQWQAVVCSRRPNQSMNAGRDTVSDERCAECGGALGDSPRRRAGTDVLLYSRECADRYWGGDAQPLTEISAVSARTAAIFSDAGFETVEQVYTADKNALAEVDGYDDQKAAFVQAQAAETLGMAEDKPVGESAAGTGTESEEPHDRR
jgi:hypothetical protein